MFDSHDETDGDQTPVSTVVSTIGAGAAVTLWMKPASSPPVMVPLESRM